jgi:hypothetical protein
LSAERQAQRDASLTPLTSAQRGALLRELDALLQAEQRGWSDMRPLMR